MPRFTESGDGKKVLCHRCGSDDVKRVKAGSSKTGKKRTRWRCLPCERMFKDRQCGRSYSLEGDFLLQVQVSIDEVLGTPWILTSKEDEALTLCQST